MPTNLDGMQIPIGVDDKTATGIAKVKESLQQLNEKAQSFGDALKTGLEALGLDLTISAFKEMVQQTVEATAAFGTLAQQTGISTKELSGLTFAAGQTSVSAESLQTSLKLLSKNMVDASNGVALSKDAFAALGVSVTDASGNMRPLNDVLLDVANKFSQSKDGADKARVALQLFGRSGTDMIPLLNKGRDGIAELTQKADELGITIDEKTAKQMDEFANMMKTVSAESDAAKRQFVVGLIPALEDIANAFGTAKDRMSLFKSAGEELGRDLKILVDTLNAGYYEAQKFGLELGKLIQQAYLNPSAGAAIDAKIAQLDAERQKFQDSLNLFGNNQQQQSGSDTTTKPTGSIHLINSAELEKEQQAAEKLLGIFQQMQASGSLDEINAKYQKMIDEVQMLIEKYPSLGVEGRQTIDAINQAWGDAVTKLKLKNQEFFDSFSNKVLASMLSVPVEGVRTIQDIGRQIETTFRAIAAQEKAVTDEGKKLGASQFVIDQELKPLREKEIKDLQTLVDYYTQLAQVQIQNAPQLLEQAKKYQAQLDQLKASAQSFGDILEKDFYQQGVTALEGIATHTKSVSDAFKQMALSIIQDIEKMIVEMLVFKAISGIAGAFGFGGGAGASFNAASPQLSFLQLPSGVPVLGHASGGSFSAGQPMLVGELGPEMILPNTSGTVIPNSKLGGNQYFIDARNAQPGVERDIMRAIKASENNAVVRSVRAIDSRAKRRG